MQPHSMCAVALANIVWNRGLKSVSFCRLRVQYVSGAGNTTNKYYDLTGINATDNRLSVTINRSGGGLSCTMDLKIDSQRQVEMTHRTQHVAGLMERFRLEKKEISGGTHRNSFRYKNFSGSIKFEQIIQLQCEVLDSKRKQFNSVPYTLTIDSIKY